MKRKTNFQIKWLIIVFAFISPFLFSSCMLFTISEKEEIQIGKRVAPTFEAKFGGHFQDGVTQEYVNEIGQKIGRVCDRRHLKYQFKVLNSGVVNAFALPGGFVYITRGLLSKLKNEAQLAFILGHEVGHVVARHSVSRLQTAMTLNIILLAVSAVEVTQRGRPGTWTAIGRVAGFLLMMRFSRDDEYEADLYGVRYSYKTGYNPRAGISVMKLFKKLEGREPWQIEEFIRTHPLSRNRMERIEKQIQAECPGVVNNPTITYGRESFFRGTRNIRALTHSYKPFDKAQRLKAKGINVIHKTKNSAAASQYFRQAISYYNKAIQNNPNQAVFYSGRGVCFLYLNNLHNAKMSLEQAVGLNPNHTITRYALGITYYRMGRFNNALNEFNNTLRLNPGAAEPHYFLGRIYQENFVNINYAINEYSVYLNTAGKNGEFYNDTLQRYNYLRKVRGY